ncbi:POLR1A [Bugula neritina]|uniref:DNA-directed RNA polymerase subunit n=1 Tax=Bugula neritina TaxID=10212 RepID=A0A7J7JKI6_BUGNE|nr:POLR1A [Bugula neritina]
MAEVPKQFTQLEFGCYTDDDARKLSVLEVTNSKTFDTLGHVTANGLYDRKLGPHDRTEICGTCSLTDAKCSGHMGHIELPMPVYNPMWMSQLELLVRGSCFSCKKILEDNVWSEQIICTVRLIDAGLWDKIDGLLEIYCELDSVGATQIMVQMNEYVNKVIAEHTPVEVSKSSRYAIFTRKDLIDKYKSVAFKNQKGQNIYKYLTLSIGCPFIYVVIFSTCKYTVVIFSTCKYTVVIFSTCKYTVVIFSTCAAGHCAHCLVPIRKLKIENHVRFLFNEGASKQGIARAKRALTARQKSKLKAKRAKAKKSASEDEGFEDTMDVDDEEDDKELVHMMEDSSAEDIGIPEVFAKRLTFPESVNVHNVDRLRKAVINGPNTHPGATHVVNEKGMMTLLSATNQTQREALARTLLTVESDSLNAKPKTVCRHLKNGDMLLMNRQPTLHRPSIQAHKYLVPKNGAPLAGLIQDHVIGGVTLCMRGRFFTREEYQQLVFSGLVDQQTRVKLLPPAVI